MIDQLKDWIQEHPVRVLFLTLAADALIVTVAALLYLTLTRRKKV